MLSTANMIRIQLFPICQVHVLFLEFQIYLYMLILSVMNAYLKTPALDKLLSSILYRIIVPSAMTVTNIFLFYFQGQSIKMCQIVI